MTLEYYNKLEQIFAEANILSQISSILSWDGAVMLPSGASESRGKQLAYLSQLARKTVTSDQVRSLISKINQDELSPWQSSNIRSIKRIIEHYEAIPQELEEKQILASNRSELVWREAKQESNFQLLLPHLADLIEITKEVALCKSEFMGISDPYEALMDTYDPGRKVKQVDEIFGELEAFLPPFIEEVIDRQKPLEPISGHFPAKTQQIVAREIASSLGFDFNNGRLDISSHPFCGGHPLDIRITSRYDESDLLSGLYGVIHETGHAIYESGRPLEWINQPVSSSIGMAMHESQSLLTENQIGMSRAFISFILPKLIKAYNLDAQLFSIDFVYKHISSVKKSFIRVNADEVTYPLHIILRYKMERDIISGKIEARHIRSVWNDEFKKLFGIVPGNDSEGCLQDIHWPSGGFGYFPSYTIGAMMAAQMMCKIREEIRDVDADISSGNFANIYSWLRDKIHSKGSLFGTAEATLKHATGESLRSQYFINHLKNRYQK
jgi:carboxypeptidase Taq